MEIVVRDVAEPAAPDVPPLVRETSSMDVVAEQLTLPDSDDGTHTFADLAADIAADIAAEPKTRGRPKGSKNQPKIIEYEEIAPPPQGGAKHVPPQKPRASRPRVAPREDVGSIPQPQTPLQVAASMLGILRLEQAERAHRKGQLYKSWIQ